MARCRRFRACRVGSGTAWRRFRVLLDGVRRRRHDHHRPRVGSRSRVKRPLVDAGTAGAGLSSGSPFPPTRASHASRSEESRADPGSSARRGSMGCPWPRAGRGGGAVERITMVFSRRRTRPGICELPAFPLWGVVHVREVLHCGSKWFCWFAGRSAGTGSGGAAPRGLPQISLTGSRPARPTCAAVASAATDGGGRFMKVGIRSNRCRTQVASQTPRHSAAWRAARRPPALPLVSYRTQRQHDASARAPERPSLVDRDSRRAAVTWSPGGVSCPRVQAAPASAASPLPAPVSPGAALERQVLVEPDHPEPDRASLRTPECRSCPSLTAFTAVGRYHRRCGRDQTLRWRGTEPPGRFRTLRTRSAPPTAGSTPCRPFRVAIVAVGLHSLPATGERWDGVGWTIQNVTNFPTGGVARRRLSHLRIGVHRRRLQR